MTLLQKLQADDLHNALLTAAAALHASNGLGQQEIADAMGISQPQVSRRLKVARDMGWLVTEARLNRKEIPAEVLNRLDQDYLAFPELRRQVKQWAPPGIRCRLRVIHAVEDAFCRFAAAHAGELIGNSDLLGVMWGRTMSGVIAGLRDRFSSSPRHSRHVKVVPVCGEPLHLVNVERQVRYSATWLAAELYRSITGKEPRDLPSLSGVPAYVSSHFSSGEIDVIRKFISRIPGYRQIFGPSEDGGPIGPLIEGIDTILTGVGIVGDGESMGTFLRERLAQEPKVSPRELAAWVYGDLGGVLLQRPGLSPEAADLVEVMNHGWVGMTAGHFRNCTRRASERDLPGVIVVASGAAKAEMVRAAVQSGYVNELIINHECAAALEDAARPGTGKSSAGSRRRKPR